jgi:hypothetical protein
MRSSLAMAVAPREALRFHFAHPYGIYRGAPASIDAFGLRPLDHSRR